MNSETLSTPRAAAGVLLTLKSAALAVLVMILVVGSAAQSNSTTANARAPITVKELTTIPSGAFPDAVRVNIRTLCSAKIYPNR